MIYFGVNIKSQTCKLNRSCNINECINSQSDCNNNLGKITIY